MTHQIFLHNELLIFVCIKILGGIAWRLKQQAEVIAVTFREEMAQNDDEVMSGKKYFRLVRKMLKKKFRTV